MRSEYDVIVVGAGPAGSIAARTAAEKGLEVLLIEKRQEIGDPVRCGEGIGKKELGEFIGPDPRWICAELSGSRLFSPDGTMVELSEKKSFKEIGYVLDRKLFDRAVARSAAEAGAEVQVKTQATSLIIEKGRVCGIRGKHRGDDFEARAKVVVGADGIESKVGKWAGIDTGLKPGDLYTGAQFLVAGVDLDPGYAEFYFGNDRAPGGYAWVFPKGKKEANVGLGMVGSRFKDKRAIGYAKAFTGWRFPEGRTIELVVGGVPCSGPLRELSRGGLLLVGDAAHLSDPLTGGGIYNGMFSGRIAGAVIARAISGGDVSATKLKQYDLEILDTIGRKLERNHRAKEIVIGATDRQMNAVARSLRGASLDNISAPGLLKEILARNPLMFKELMGIL